MSLNSVRPLLPAAVIRIVETVLSTQHGVFQMIGYRAVTGAEHITLVRGNDTDLDGAPLVCLHSECLTGDAFGSWRCDCGDQLDAALTAIDKVPA